MRLSEYARSRDNNFTLLRLIAALTVVLVHSAPVLGLGSADRDFLLDYVGRTFGAMALDMAVRDERLPRHGEPVQPRRPQPFPLGEGAQALSRRSG